MAQSQRAFLLLGVFAVAMVAADTPPPVLMVAPLDGETITSFPIKVHFKLRKPGTLTAISMNGFRVKELKESKTQAEIVTDIPFVVNGSFILRVDPIRADGSPRGPHAEVSLHVRVPWNKPPPPPEIPRGYDEDGNKLEMRTVDKYVIYEGGVGMRNFYYPDMIENCQLAEEGWRERENHVRVFDAFMFFNELDVLEVRLNELDKYVDVFIISEATTTHQGTPKPLFFAEAAHEERFAKFRHKIRHLPVDDLPSHPDSWVIENYHRNTLLRALFDASPEDLVLIGDVDEVPRPNVLKEFVQCDGYGTPAFLYGRFYNFRFQYEFATSWTHGPRLVRRGDLEPLGYLTPQQVRDATMRKKMAKIDDAMWHMSFFADAKGILFKLKCFAHAEFNSEYWLQEGKIQEAIDNGIDIFNADSKGNPNEEPRSGGLLKNMDCEDIPQYVLDNPGKFARWIPHCNAMQERLSGA